jgi:group I intron endonuclease
MIIYRITNRVNGKSYIGKTVDNTPKHRWNVHRNPNTISPIASAIQLYGEENFTVQIIAMATGIDQLNAQERSLIAHYNTFTPFGYNAAPGGFGGCYIRGDQHWTRKYPHRMQHGDQHFSRRHPDRIARGELVGTHVLTTKIVRQLRAIRGNTHLTVREIHELSGVAFGTLKDVLSHRSWR